MEVELLLSNMINKSENIAVLTSQMEIQKQTCLKRAQSQKQIDFCYKDQQNYQAYLKQYKQQFKEKALNICMANLQGNLNEQFAQRKKCVVFYMKSFKVFQDNVKDKLNSLVNKLDYIEL